MIECHTPFSDQELVNLYRDEFVLVSGLGRMLDIACEKSEERPHGYGYKRAVDIEELYALYPESVPSLNMEKHYSSKTIEEKLA
mmetsp:Transcript_15764/g.26609  ORF Transcript_15764/g.26609 Transcript_15764/m.26609 type:complete len:84 (+) Transcript_15764:400-651(+)